MPPPRREDLDQRIVECWRAGMRSAGDIGRRIGLDRMHVGRRIARMVKARSWPFEPPTKHAPADGPARRVPSGAVVGRRPPARAEPTAMASSAPLNLRITGDLHTRLRAHCRETGATVSETVAEALDAFLRGKER